MATKKSSELFSSLLYIVIGIILAVFPNEAIGWAMTIAGVIFLVAGILELIKKNFVGGAISLIIGIVILVLGNTLKDIVILVLGILIAIKGIIALVGVFTRQGNKNALQIVFPILTIVLGVLLAFGGLLEVLILVVGVLLVIDGIIGLIGALKK